MKGRLLEVAAKPKITDPPEVVADLYRRETGDSVARRYGVTPAAIVAFLVRHDLYERKMNDHRDVIPWRLHKLDGMAAEIRYLRTLGCRDKGLDVDPRALRLAEDYERKLVEQNAVVCYNPKNRAEPFWYEHRRDGDLKYARPNRVPVKIGR